MRRVMVRYKVKRERLDEHERLIADVFAELKKNDTQGIRYGVYKQSDGVSFVHVAIVDADKNPLDDIAAFRAFTANVRDRCEEPPVTTEYTQLQAHRL